MMLWRRTHTLLYASTAAQGHLCARTREGSQSLSRALLVQHKFCRVKDEKESKTTRKVVLFLPADEIRPCLHKEMVQSCPRTGSCSSSTLDLKHKCPRVKVLCPLGLSMHTHFPAWPSLTVHPERLLYQLGFSGLNFTPCDSSVPQQPLQSYSHRLPWRFESSLWSRAWLRVPKLGVNGHI